MDEYSCDGAVAVSDRAARKRSDEGRALTDAVDSCMADSDLLSAPKPPAQGKGGTEESVE